MGFREDRLQEEAEEGGFFVQDGAYLVDLWGWELRLWPPEDYPFMAPKIDVRPHGATEWIRLTNIRNWGPTMTLHKTAMSIVSDLPAHAQSIREVADAWFEQGIREMDPEKAEVNFARSRAREADADTLAAYCAAFQKVAEDEDGVVVIPAELSQ